MAFTLEVIPGWKTYLVSASGSQASILDGVFGGQELCSHECPHSWGHHCAACGLGAGHGASVADLVSR